MSYNIAKYVIGCRFNGLHDFEKMVDLSQTIFVLSTSEAFKLAMTHTVIHGHILMNAIGENEMRCYLFKNKAIG